jgi:hypothetical protein
MAFSEEVIGQAWKRSGGTCECVRRTHNHDSARCNVLLNKYMRNQAGEGRWETRRVNKSGSDVLANCEIVCWACYKRSQYE